MNTIINSLYKKTLNSVHTVYVIIFLSSFKNIWMKMKWERNFSRWLWRGQIFPSYSSFGLFFYQILISICILMKNKSNIPRRKEGVYIYELSFQRDVWPSCIFWEWKCKHCSNWLISAQNCRLKRKKAINMRWSMLFVCKLCI